MATATAVSFMVPPDVVGIGSEYFVVYFHMYINVRLIMSGYPFFCIYFNVWYRISHAIQNEKKLWNLNIR